MSHNTLPMRPRKVKRLVALTAFATILAGTGVGWAAEAHASPGPDYGVENAGLICDYLDAAPRLTTVAAIGNAIVSEGYLSYYQAGQAIGAAVNYACPQHWPLLNQFIAASNAPAYIA